MRIIYKNSAFALNTASAVKIDEFPSVPNQMQGRILTLSIQDIKKAVRCSKFSNKGDIRPAMSGVYFGTAEIVATNGHVLWREQYEIPVHTVREINVRKKLIDSLENESVSIYETSENVVAFVNSDSIAYVRELLERFPNYQSVIPQNYSNSFEVNKKDFQGLLSLADTIKGKEKKDQGLVFTVHKSLILSLQNIEAGKSYSGSINAVTTSYIPKFSLNIVTLQGMLKEIDAEILKFEVKDANSVVSVNNQLIMPQTMSS